jgi:hypothetical protein
MRFFGVLSLSGILASGAVSFARAQTKIKANDLVLNGESFFAIANIASELTRLARADGYMDASVSVHQIAVSGAVMTGILNQYKNCTPKPTFMITDGGGNDLMGSCGGTVTPDCAEIKSALNTVQQYFTEMKNSGTKRVIWMRYADPYGSNWATLKANQDVYNPEVEKICKASETPKCYWIDMRTTWEGHYAEYTSDGIHPTAAGGTATAEAFWKFAKSINFFDLGATGLDAGPETAAGTFRGQRIADRSLELSLSLDRPAEVSVRLLSLTGRTILNATTTAPAGFRTERFPLPAVPAGVYRLDVRAGAAHHRSAILAP